jgi:Fe-Mn family superoxide dismutase
MEMNRRDAVKTMALSGLAMTTIGAWASDKKTEKKEVVFNSNEVKPISLSFDPKKLTGISEKMIQSHWENNYIGSVKALNGVNKQLKDAFRNKDTATFIIGGLKREQLLRTGSVVNHDLYFENLGGNGKIDGSIKNAVSQVFSSDNTWETEFRRIAATLSGGSGWVILGYNYHLKSLENFWCYDHLHAPAATFPLLVMDMYEHSYQLDYGAAAAKYIEAFFSNINWDVVNRRFEKISSFA